MKRQLLVFRGPCFPIKIPSGDPLGRDCMEFVRSLAYSFPNGTQQGNVMFCPIVSLVLTGHSRVTLCFVLSLV